MCQRKGTAAMRAVACVRAPLHIAIDGVGAKHSGAATVLLAVVDAALSHSGVRDVTVFCSPQRMRSFVLPNSSRLHEVQVRWGEAGPIARLAWHAVGLPRAVYRAKAQSILFLGAGGRSCHKIPSIAFVQQSLPFSN